MYKVKQLYADISDESGHTYLIKKEDIRAFEKCLSRIEDSYSEHKDDEIFFDEFTDLLDNFNAKLLEGEQVYIVLPEDIEGENE